MKHLTFEQKYNELVTAVSGFLDAEVMLRGAINQSTINHLKIMCDHAATSNPKITEITPKQPYPAQRLFLRPVGNA
jgi:hypothetical protein